MSKTGLCGTVVTRQKGYQDAPPQRPTFGLRPKRAAWGKIATRGGVLGKTGFRANVGAGERWDDSPPASARGGLARLTAP